MRLCPGEVAALDYLVAGAGFMVISGYPPYRGEGHGGRKGWGRREESAIPAGG